MPSVHLLSLSFIIKKSTIFFQIRQFWAFYRAAVTPYQLHSPLVFELANALLSDERWFYAFRDIEVIRQKMLQSKVPLTITDFGAGSGHERVVTRTDSVANVAKRAASSPKQGRHLFRLVQWAAPDTMLELGTSLGIGTMYLASSARNARFISLEGCADCAGVARANLDLLALKKVSVVTGAFEDTLERALKELDKIDLIYIDGNHRKEPTLEYFEKCLPHTKESTVFILDDVHWSPGMADAWETIKAHPTVSLTVDFFDISLVFINPDIREKQHFCVVPYLWKPWKIL